MQTVHFDRLGTASAQWCEGSALLQSELRLDQAQAKCGTSSSKSFGRRNSCKRENP